MRWALVDPDGVVANVILWDGESDYDPGPELALVNLSPDSPVQPGDTYDDASKAFAHTAPDPVEPAPVLELTDKLAELPDVIGKAKTVPELVESLRRWAADQPGSG